MTFSGAVYDMQAAISSLGIFIGIWGFVQFAPCLWRVLTLAQLPPKHANCSRHAWVALLCMSMIVLAFARLNTIGILVFGATAAGLSYIAGMLILVAIIALAVWAAGKMHAEADHQGWRTPVDNSPDLRRVMSMVLIVTLSFVVVGLLRIGE